VTLVILASFAICLAGKFAIPLWFTPIPLVTQNTLVLLLAALLGSKRGAAAVFAFLAQGAMGLPVFANGASGFLTLLGPKAGYLFGYLIAAYIVGSLVERNKNHTALALLLGNLTIYTFGAAYLSTFIGIDKAFYLGVAPFILGDLVKSVIAYKIIGWVKN
jgi:biotin transport system substrate-specific component